MDSPDENTALTIVTTLVAAAESYTLYEVMAFPPSFSPSEITKLIVSSSILVTDADNGGSGMPVDAQMYPLHPNDANALHAAAHRV